MHVIQAENVNRAYVEGLWWLKISGVEEKSRNGPVLVSPCPVMTIYRYPRERVLFDTIRDCNPFFHLFEAVWMLAGCREVLPLLAYNKRMQEFAEPGGHIHGAYGDRWLRYFGKNQPLCIIQLLKANPQDRQAVLSMWDPCGDLGLNVRDKPCNTHCYFRIVEGNLDMTICCRSNDIIWGAYGANAVHFSILQEFIANAVGVPVGKMYQFSNNFHMYKNVPRYEQIMLAPGLDRDPYSAVRPYPRILAPEEDPERFLYECRMVMEEECIEQVESPWLNEVVIPMMHLWRTRDMALLHDVEAEDWRAAFDQWLSRRSKYGN